MIGPGLEVTDPIYQRPCVYYGVVVEQRVLTIEDSALTHKWITLFDESSGLRPFWLVDPTGQTLVWAPDADMRYTSNRVYSCGFFGSLFGSSVELEFLRKVKKQRVFMRRVRLSVQVLRPGTALFVVGCAVIPDSFKPADGKLAYALSEASALDRGRVIVRGDAPFIIGRSAPQVTERRAGTFMHVLSGIALIVASLLVLGFFWLVGVR